GVGAGQTVYIWATTIQWPDETSVDVDVNNDVAESDESNNTFFQIVAIPTLPAYCETPPPHTPTTGPITLTASAACVDESLAVTISAGDGPFNITASAGVNTPVNGVNIGTTMINGPEKWDNLTVSETTGDIEST